MGITDIGVSHYLQAEHTDGTAPALYFPRAESYTLLKRTWPFLTEWQRNDYDEALVELAGNLPHGTGWKSILQGAEESCLQKGVLWKHSAMKFPKRGSGGACWPLKLLDAVHGRNWAMEKFHIHCRSLMMEKLYVLQEPDPRNPEAVHTAVAQRWRGQVRCISLPSELT